MYSNFLIQILFLSLFTSVSCVNGTIEKPPPPDVTTDQKQFDEPAGAIEQDNMADITTLSDDVVNQWGPLCGWGADTPGPLCSNAAECKAVRCDLVELVRSLVRVAIFFVARNRAQVDDPPVDESGRPIASVTDYVKRAEGFGTLTQICPGYGSGDRANPENGSLSLNMGFTDDGLDAVLWGSFDQCQYTTGPLGNVAINGDIVTKYGGISNDGGPATLLTIINLRLRGFGAERSIQSAILQNFESEELQVYLPINGGIVLFQTPEASGYRDSIGILKCNFEERTCVREDSSEVLEW